MSDNPSTPPDLASLLQQAGVASSLFAKGDLSAHIQERADALREKREVKLTEEELELGRILRAFVANHGGDRLLDYLYHRFERAAGFDHRLGLLGGVANGFRHEGQRDMLTVLEWLIDGAMREDDGQPAPRRKRGPRKTSK